MDVPFDPRISLLWAGAVTVGLGVGAASYAFLVPSSELALCTAVTYAVLLRAVVRRPDVLYGSESTSMSVVYPWIWLPIVLGTSVTVLLGANLGGTGDRTGTAVAVLVFGAISAGLVVGREYERLVLEDG